MISIKLYKPSEFDQDIQFPENWDELSLDELHIYSKSILAGFDSPEVARAFVFNSIFDYRANKTGIHKILTPEEVVLNGLPMIEFLYKNNELSKQPYPTLKVTGIRNALPGPADDFNDITCGEFEDTEIFYFQFRQTGDPVYLAHMAAILFRPGRKAYISLNIDGTHTVYTSDHLVKSFSRLKPWILYTLFIWYTGCRENLAIYFPDVYDGEEVDTPNPSAWTECIHAAAGPKNGTRVQVRMCLLKEILFDMNIESQKAKEIEKLYASKK